MESSWSLGVLIWLPIAILLTLGLIALFVLFAVGQHRARDSYDSSDFTIAKWATGGVLVIFVAINLVGFYPWSAEYHQFRPVTGTIDVIEKRIVGGDSIEEKFVVRYTTGEERGCLDTRCALLKPGDTLTLKCKRQWQYTGTDGWDCTYVGSRKAA